MSERPGEWKEKYFPKQSLVITHSASPKGYQFFPPCTVPCDVAPREAIVCTDCGVRGVRGVVASDCACAAGGKVSGYIHENSTVCVDSSPTMLHVTIEDRCSRHILNRQRKVYLTELARYTVHQWDAGGWCLNPKKDIPTVLLLRFFWNPSSATTFPFPMGPETW